MMRRRLIALVALVVLVAVAAGCGSDRTPPRRSSATGPVVVVISVDGLNPDALTRLGSRRLPAFARLASGGASTLDARTSYEKTRTLPNHTGMMTGLAVGGADGHHVTFNEDDGRTLEELNGRYLPGMFDVAHDHRLRTALYASKPKFEFLVRSWDAEHGARDRTGADDGRDKLDTARIAATGELLDAMLARLRTHPAHLTFLHLAAPDGAGHGSGFMSASYLDAVARTDRQVGRVLDAIESTPGLRARTTVVLTADHGGDGPGHENFRSPANYTIPFYVWGRGARKGADLYRLNPGRQDPGDARPSYDGPQPVRNLDVADLALRLLGLPPVPGTPSHGEGVLVTE